MEAREKRLPVKKGALETQAVVIVACLVPGQAAGAVPFTQAFFFRDSTTDTGNICAPIFDPSDPACSPPYFPGRSSNGPIWAEYFGDALGLSAIPAVVPGGTNFAVAGARSEDLATEIAFFIDFFVDPNARALPPRARGACRHS